MWNLKNKIHKQNRNRLIDAENKLIISRGDGVGVGVKKMKELRGAKKRNIRKK